MAKELPYFKFFPAEWLKGDITLCSMAAQGLFINICTYYWMKDCNMSLTSVEQRFNTCSTEIKELLDSGVLTSDDNGDALIKFLDEQFSEFDEIREKRSKAGKISAKSRGGKKPSTSVKQVLNNKDKDEDKELDKDKEKDFLIQKKVLKDFNLKTSNEFGSTPSLIDSFVEYMTHRESLNKPLSQRAAQLAITKLKEVSNNKPLVAINIINQAIRGGYTDFKPMQY